jgi:hypothetical protein
MKISFTVILLGALFTCLKAQWDLPVTFEDANEVVNWSTFANNELENDLKQVENPAKNGINSSDYCCEFIIDADATQWVGAWSNAYGYTAFTQTRHSMELMVYSDTIHTVGVRGQNPLEPGADLYGAIAEAKMTKTNEWELLTLDFSQSAGITYSTLTFFADINENRTQGSTLYWDNLDWVETTSVEGIIHEQMRVYPNPVKDKATIEYSEMRNITLTNMQGQQVFTLDFGPAGSKVIDLSLLKSGVYILKIDSEEGLAFTKIIKR